MVHWPIMRIRSSIRQVVRRGKRIVDGRTWGLASPERSIGLDVPFSISVVFYGLLSPMSALPSLGFSESSSRSLVSYLVRLSFRLRTITVSPLYSHRTFGRFSMEYPSSFGASLSFRCSVSSGERGIDVPASVESGVVVHPYPHGDFRMGVQPCAFGLSGKVVPTRTIPYLTIVCAISIVFASVPVKAGHASPIGIESRPTTDIDADWERSGCAANAHYDCLNEGYASPDGNATYVASF